jgi:hypothetical protein
LQPRLADSAEAETVGKSAERALGREAATDGAADGAFCDTRPTEAVLDASGEADTLRDRARSKPTACSSLVKF